LAILSNRKDFDIKNAFIEAKVNAEIRLSVPITNLNFDRAIIKPRRAFFLTPASTTTVIPIRIELAQHILVETLYDCEKRGFIIG
jgi:hypothetical protein